MESLRGLQTSPASAYDELVTGQKSIRYHWQGILSVIRSLPAYPLMPTTAAIPTSPPASEIMAMRFTITA